MFSIIISEKGGAERKETFDKNEINVGRVQGNDLMLPKGNVSKHHARLLYRDGRFIVTDLKSTNGTYVNGRKIAQATIVREGDKIYIGDFVLRLDAGQAPAAALDVEPRPEGESIRTLQRNPQQVQPPPPPAVPQGPGPTLKAATHPPNPQLGTRPPATPAVAGLQPRNEPGAVSHFPLERDPDESEPAGQKMPPARMASAIPTGLSPQPGPSGLIPQAAPSGLAPGLPPQPVPLAGIAPPPQAREPRGGTMQLQQSPAAPSIHGRPAPLSGGSQPMPAPPPVAAPAPVAPLPMPPPAVALAGSRPAPRETAAQAGRRLALITLVDRIADAVDLRPLKTSPLIEDALAQQIDRAAHEQANQMRDEGEVPEGVDVEALVRDAVRELVGLGPVGPLLEDDDVTEIHCVRSDQVLAMRDGQTTLAEASFTSDEALFRVIARLAYQSGDPWKAGELVLERRLPRGAQMIAIAPPASGAHVLVVRKKRRIDTSLEDLVRTGSLSRPMAVFLETCFQARANVLVCGPSPSGTSQIVAALASSGPAGERIALVHELDEINVAHAHMVSLPLLDTRARGEEVVRAAAKLHPDRLVVGPLVDGVAAGTLEAIAGGAEGVLATACAPTLRQALARLVSQLLLTRAGASAEAIREAIGESFDVAIELGVTAEGRPRIERIAELAGSDGKGVVTRELFVVEGADHVATGAVPRLATELAARGIKLDQSIFKRGR